MVVDTWQDADAPHRRMPEKPDAPQNSDLSESQAITFKIVK